MSSRFPYVRRLSIFFFFLETSNIARLNASGEFYTSPIVHGRIDFKESNKDDNVMKNVILQLVRPVPLQIGQHISESPCTYSIGSIYALHFLH